MQRSDVVAHLQRAGARVHLPQRRALAEEQRLLGVHHDPVEVGLPVPVRLAGLQQEKLLLTDTQS